MTSSGNNFNYFPKTNRPNWHIQCSLNVCLCLVWQIEGSPCAAGWLRRLAVENSALMFFNCRETNRRLWLLLAAWRVAPCYGALVTL